MSSCSNCGLHELCIPTDLSADDLKRLDQLVYARRKLCRGEELYRAGDQFGAIYSIRSGSFKKEVALEDGRQQVIDFLMSGDVLGMDGIGTDRYSCNAVALEDSVVCVIPFVRLEAISREVRGLQHQFHRVMGREMVRHQAVKMLLGGARAGERVAAFLLTLSRRFEERGYSASEFILRMNREDIGSFLGIQLETVSRVLSQFHRDNLVAVMQKYIRILNAPGLRHVAGSMGEAQPATTAKALLAVSLPAHQDTKRAASKVSALGA
ncbi:MAG: transcriptional regulator [Betaproteobacteria bacterium RIFCSPLOWO2_12_FULL_63_13]|nr:MAG: transcriptional regulator [Betaproteobacteria bacterium RIFCSPLOWO2_12_FULL_63_13]